jgi:flagellar protein FlaG
MNINAIAQPAAEIPRPAPVRTAGAPAAVAPLVAAADTQARFADPQAVREAVTAANEAMKAIKSELDFSIDESTGKTVVRVLDRETGAIIRQMPAKELLEIAKMLDRLQGLLVRGSA